MSSPTARRRIMCSMAAAVALAGCGGSAAPSIFPMPPSLTQPAPPEIPGRTPIKHIVIVFQENRTFDNIFHGYPGAHWARFGYNHLGKKVWPQPIPLITRWDPAHEYENWLVEYNGGKMNGFDLEAVDAGFHPPKDFAYDYARHGDVKPYWDLAAQGVLGDEMFADHRSQTYAGHLYVIAGAAGPIDSMDRDWYVANNPIGGLSCAAKGAGEAIDLRTGATDKNYQTCFNFKTIGDLLSKRGVSWRYYVPFGDREDIMDGYASIAHDFDGSEWANVTSPETTLFSDIDNRRLPAVSWVISQFANSDHPGQDVPSSNGPSWVANVFNALGESGYWKDTAIVLTYDDWGGWFDDVKPKTFNYYEAGFRIPLVIVSPYAKRGYVSHKVHYTGSLLHFIEYTFGLPSLHTTDARSDRFADCFDFSQRPLPYIRITPPQPLESLLQSGRYANAPADPNLRD
ncbi:MAG TPA: alkaline phosphatase family protein [Candidatus Cybelea sp.]|nr:alkaline phosphatase family protein [Candidatus Cybelea sp.]